MEQKQSNAVFYARYSSSSQRDLSIDAQIRACEKFCKEQNITHIKSYIDRAKTGTNDKREAFNQMLSDAKNNKFDCIIVHKLDRFSRDMRIAQNAIYELNKNGITVLSVIENFGDTPEGFMQTGIQLVLAQYYSQNLSREVKKGKQENFHKRMSSGSVPAIGLKVDPLTKHYEINEETS